MKFLCLFAGLLLLWSSVGFAGEFLVYFGTYTGAKSKGIYVSRFDPATGTLSAPELAAATRNPSFLAIHPSGHFLYAVGEVDDAGGKPGGTVCAFSLDRHTGRLTLAESAGLRRQRTLSSLRGCHGQMSPGGEL